MYRLLAVVPGWLVRSTCPWTPASPNRTTKRKSKPSIPTSPTKFPNGQCPPASSRSASSTRTCTPVPAQLLPQFPYSLCGFPADIKERFAAARPGRSLSAGGLSRANRRYASIPRRGNRQSLRSRRWTSNWSATALSMTAGNLRNSTGRRPRQYLARRNGHLAGVNDSCSSFHNRSGILRIGHCLSRHGCCGTRRP